MRSRIAPALALAVTATLVGGCRSTVRSVGPGEAIERMTLVSGTSSQADLTLFDFCDSDSGTDADVSFSCRVRRVRRLFIGWGAHRPTRKELQRDWQHMRWNLWVDGHPVDLPAFGTADRTGWTPFPDIGGEDDIRREWKVILVGATPGKHTLKYRTRSPQTADGVWTFVVAKK